MNRQLVFLGGLGLGAALMYILDPDRGKRRRALVRDQVVSATQRTRTAVARGTRDLNNRVRGLVAEASTRLTSDAAPDRVLCARVRAKLGRAVSHPGAIEVAVEQGNVILSGPVLAHEVDTLLSCVSAVRGVRDVDNRLDVYEHADGVPALQDGGEHTRHRFTWTQKNWPPAARLLASAAASALTVYGLSRRGPLGLALGAAGAGLITHRVTTRDPRRGASASSTSAASA